jgi:hypothetical protein
LGFCWTGNLRFDPLLSKGMLEESCQKVSS